MPKLQSGKAKEVFANWGVRPRELDKLLEAGLVRARQSRRGKGGLRLLDEASVYDVFLAHTFRELGWPRGRIARVLRTLRAHYRAWMREDTRWLVLRMMLGDSYPATAPMIRIDLEQPRRLARAWATLGDAAAIRRGRPRSDWRAEFREAAAAIGREMQERQVAEADVDRVIDEVRAERSAYERSAAVVTVQA